MDANASDWRRLVLTLYPNPGDSKKENCALLALDGVPIARVVVVGTSRVGGRGVSLAIEAPLSVRISRENVTLKPRK
jgi:sRNA-binding carbon storage regulator CsrA